MMCICLDDHFWKHEQYPWMIEKFLVFQAEKRRSRAREGEQESCKISISYLKTKKK